MILVTIEHDQDAEDPINNGYSDWKLISFLNRHPNYENPDDWLRPLDDTGREGNAQFAYLYGKRQLGEAFMLDYYEHSDAYWSLAGEGMQCQWDTSGNAGILLYESTDGNLPKDKEELRKLLDVMLEEYNDWSNGATYYFVIERLPPPYPEDFDPDLDDPEDHDGLVDVASCSGYIGEDHMIKEINEILKKFPGEKVVVTGECKWVADYHDIETPPLSPAEGGV